MTSGCGFVGSTGMDWTELKWMRVLDCEFERCERLCILSGVGAGGWLV